MTRIPLLWTPFLDVDETLFALYAKIWAHGGRPYVDFAENKALGVYLFYLIPSVLTGSLPQIHMIGVHFLSLVWTLLTALTLYVLGKRWDSEKTGFLAAIFFIAFSAAYIPKIVATNIEVILLLPWTLSLFCLWKKTAELRLSDSLLCGILLSLAILCKYQAGILIPVILLYFWLIAFYSDPYLSPTRWGVGGESGFAPDYTVKHPALPVRTVIERPWTWKNALSHTFAFGIGGTLFPALMLIYLKKIHVFDDFILWNFKASAYYIGAGSNFLPWIEVLSKKVLPFLLATGFLWYLLFHKFVQNLHEGTSKENRRREMLLWLWFLASIIPVCMGRRFYPHYFLLLMPSASLLAASALSHFDADLLKKRRWIFLTAFLVPLIGFSVARLFMNPIYDHFKSSDHLSVFKHYAQYLKERTSPSDRIFVWGFSPTIYWDADRLPASRFLSSSYLSGRVNGMSKEKALQMSSTPGTAMPEAWNLFFEDMKNHPPTYIIDMAPTGLDGYEGYSVKRYPQLMSFIEKNYTEETFQNATIYKKK